jgi:hypothetical protein
MARKPRVISAPPARGGSMENGWTQLSGSMGALAADQGPIGNIPPTDVPDADFEAPQDLNYDRMIAERERELGLPPEPPTHVTGAAYREPAYAGTPGGITYVPDLNQLPRYVTPQEPEADLTPLPDKFSLSIERKSDMWKVTSPGVHSGLWKAGPSLPRVVEEALAALAEMVRIDGVATKGRRK